MTYNEAMARSRRVTTKYRNYGPLYDLVLADLPADPTVLEVGIANGGSLETWRSLFGPGARIAGVDLNQHTTVLREEGFEVHILDTGRPESWAELARTYGRSVDLLVDDGGHTNRQQVEAIVHGIDLVKDGGWIVIEDLHASFMKEFGNPGRYSAVNFLDELMDDLHRVHDRSSVPPKHPNLARSIEYVISSTSWAGLKVNRWDPSSRDELTAGTEAGMMDYDHRWDDSSSTARKVAAALPKPVADAAKDAYLKVQQTAEMRALFTSDGPSPQAPPPTASDR